MGCPDASVHVVPSTIPTERLGQRDCVLSDGRTVAYAVAGDSDGVPILVHHGTPGCRLFASLLTDAARDVGARLIVPDRPGYGRSSPPPTDWTWTDWRRDCDELLAAESVDSAATLGFSGGGPFALATAASERTTRVGLVSAVVPPLDGRLATLARLPFAIRLLFRLTDVAAQFGRAALVAEQIGRASPRSSTRRSTKTPAHRHGRIDCSRPVDSTYGRPSPSARGTGPGTTTRHSTRSEASFGPATAR